MDLKSCTPLRPLIQLVLGLEPDLGQTGGAFYRRVLRLLPDGIPVGDGPDDELSVIWLDGEVCVGLPELARYLRGQERRAGRRSATECRSECVGVLTALEERARRSG